MNTFHNENCLLLSEVSYQREGEHIAGESVLLGYFAEIIYPKLRGLGLVSRIDLRPAELDLINSKDHDQLSQPYDFLAAEFEKAWNMVRDKKSNALTYLSTQHNTTLRILPPENIVFTSGKQVTNVLEAKVSLLQFLNRKGKELRLTDDEDIIAVNELFAYQRSAE